jgi:hypothetical protein
MATVCVHRVKRVDASPVRRLSNGAGHEFCVRDVFIHTDKGLEITLELFADAPEELGCDFPGVVDERTQAKE